MNVTGLNVLVVEDDALIAMGTLMMLEDMGHVAHQAQSGEEALALLESGTAIDVVVSDHAMPGMSGAGLADAAEMGDSLRLLRKPFRERDLARILADVVGAGAER